MTGPSLTAAGIVLPATSSDNATLTPSTGTLVRVRILGDEDRLVLFTDAASAQQEVDAFNALAERVTDSDATGAELVDTEPFSTPLIDFIGITAEWTDELENDGWTCEGGRWSHPDGPAGLTLLEAHDHMEG